MQEALPPGVALLAPSIRTPASACIARSPTAELAVTDDWRACQRKLWQCERHH